jgi:hypothetical protein
MGARWYDPATGGFTSSDTINGSPVPSTADGNPYAYTYGNPLTQTDRTGHSPGGAVCPVFGPDGIVWVPCGGGSGGPLRPAGGECAWHQGIPGLGLRCALRPEGQGAGGSLRRGSGSRDSFNKVRQLAESRIQLSRSPGEMCPDRHGTFLAWCSALRISARELQRTDSARLSRVPARARRLSRLPVRAVRRGLARTRRSQSGFRLPGRRVGGPARSGSGFARG